MTGLRKSLEYDKQYKQFMGTRSYPYLEWLKDIVIYDDKLEIGLEIEGLTLTVKDSRQDDKYTFKSKSLAWMGK